MKTLLKEILQNSKENKKIIGIRVYENDDYFYAGYVLDFNDKVVQLQHFTEYGIEDGIVLEPIENIENVEIDDDYYKSLQILVQQNQKLEIKNIVDSKYNIEGNWRYNILKTFVGKPIIIVIENHKREKICGFVTKLTEQEILLNPIGLQGIDEGLSLYKLDDIYSIQPDDLECRKRLILYNSKKVK